MIKLNETTVNELLYQIKQTFTIDYDKDMIALEFYIDSENPENKIGRFVMIDALGEYLLENTVKGFKYEHVGLFHKMTIVIK